jgi:FKBP-type peptidyl-prolyl cis-trans isomerase 2
MAEATAPEPTPDRHGTIVLLDYELWAEGAGRTDLVDTTRAEAAQNAGLKLGEGHEFVPRPHVLGGDYFPSAIEAYVESLPVGGEGDREFEPAEAFGERDPKLIELFSMHEIERLPEMRREDAELDVGTVLNIRGRRGRVASLTAARVRVDFNPPYSGRKVRGKFKVVSEVTDPAEQARALVELAYGRSKEFGVEVHQHVVTLKIPDRSKFDIQWLAAKPRLVDQIRSHLKPSAIKIVEEYVTPAKEKAAAAASSEAKADEKSETEPSTESAEKGAAAAEPAKPAKSTHRHDGPKTPKSAKSES